MITSAVAAVESVRLVRTAPGNRPWTSCGSSSAPPNARKGDAFRAPQRVEVVTLRDRAGARIGIDPSSDSRESADGCSDSASIECSAVRE